MAGRNNVNPNTSTMTVMLDKVFYIDVTGVSKRKISKAYAECGQSVQCDQVFLCPCIWDLKMRQWRIKSAW